MLTVEDRFMIKDLYRAGVSISEIARRTGHDRKTVRQAVLGPLLAAPRPRPPHPAKIDPFLPYLEQRVALGVLNARKLFAEIADQGYSGRETQVRAWVQARRPAPPTQATVRFETLPGQQAQVDWGHFGTILHGGVQRKLYAFLMTLGFSRVMYLEFTVSLDTAWWLRGHLHAFAYFGGVPRQVLHDNLKSAVLGRDATGTVQWNPRYLDFATQLGFSPRACAPYRAQTKGKVENGVGYVRGNFWPGLHYVDLPDLNRQALSWLDITANRRVHGTTGVVPFSRLAVEQLAPWQNSPPYDTSVIVARRSSRDCLVSYDGNFYSVPAAYAQQDLMVKATEGGEVRVFTAQGTEIARHAQAAGHGQRVLVAAHYAGLPGKGRPTGRPQAIQVAVSTPDLRAGAPQVEIRPLAAYEQLLEARP
jgi:transposase